MVRPMATLTCRLCRQTQVFETLSGNVKFCRLMAVGFCKIWGVSARVNEVLHPMGRFGTTSPVQRMEGYLTVSVGSGMPGVFSSFATF